MAPTKAPNRACKSQESAHFIDLPPETFAPASEHCHGEHGDRLDIHQADVSGERDKGRRAEVNLIPFAMVVDVIVATFVLLYMAIYGAGP
jgi:hypothetical protein